MTLLGIYRCPEERTRVVDLTVDSTSVENKLRLKRSIYTMYQVICLTLLWFQVGRYIVDLFIVKPFISKSLLYRMSILCFALQTAVDGTVLFRMFKYKDRFHSFLTQWIEISKQAASPGSNQEQLLYRLKRTHRVVIVVLCLVHIGTSAGFLVSVQNRNELVQAAVGPFGDSPPSVGLTATLWCYNAGVWVSLAPFFAIVTKCLAFQYGSLSEKIKELVTTSTRFPVKIHIYRRLHLDLCDMVDLLNQDFKYVVATSYLLSIIVLLCIGYSVTKTAVVDVYLITMISIIAILSIHRLVALSVIAANLHEQVI
ncbi:hypothetical protein SNE40_013542 [Patella caerulea]|uniref:Gustatory receptor n=1 Tax=Patella caerulea TaxID=87958 RepID=A0AAN8JF91_PATCE